LACSSAAGDYDRAERTARSITDLHGQAQALTGVAAAAAAGDYDRARELAAAGERAIRSITDPYWQVQALIRVAAAAAAVGDYDRAERTARSIADPDAQARALADVAGSSSESARTRSCIARALAVGRWTIPLQALALVDPAALSAFADELAVLSNSPGTQDNGLLSGTASHDA
jgi:hypothetical protein